MRRLNLVSICSIALFLGTTAFSVGCGDDSTDDSGSGAASSSSSSSGGQGGNGGEGGEGGAGGSGGGATATGTINVTVTYEGTKTGTLYGLVTKDIMTPDPKHLTIVAMPAFPATVNIKDVENGDWYVVALLDDPADEPRGPLDPIKATDAVVTVDGDSHDVALTLTDPPAQ